VSLFAPAQQQASADWPGMMVRRRRCGFAALYLAVAR
jgi:hypothetical protein